MACRLARAAVCSSCTHLSSLTNSFSSSAQHRRQHFQSRVFRKSFTPKKSLQFSARSLAVGQTDSIKKTAAPSTIPSSEISAGSLDDNPMTWPSRSHGCGTLGEADVGVRVQICGWVASQRSHGGIAFVNVRDHTGIVQVTTVEAEYGQAHVAVGGLRLEYVVAIQGTIRTRPPALTNSRMATGAIEVVAEEVVVLNAVRGALPFLISSGQEDATREDVRLRYRHLDLRRTEMSESLRLRHRMVKALRRFLEDEHGFVEIETPILARSTPEGARDFLVPSRVQSGQFYALPQSPQLFKQMLMVSGFDRYFQIARCFRDEDLRADRQPEFTQLDMEMAFTPLEDLLLLNEALMEHVFREVGSIHLPRPFPRLTYAEAMARFGSDKPDLRFGMELTDVSAIMASIGFKVFSGSIDKGGVVQAITVPGGAARVSSTRLKKGDVYQEALLAGEVEGIAALVAALGPTEREELVALCGATEGDLILFAAGPVAGVRRVLDRLRNFVARSLDLIPKGAHAVLWVTDFPLVEWNEEEQRAEALHHPFTAPNPEDMADLSTARALAYDLVYNGVELGGGSLRTYRRDILERVFSLIGLSAEQAEDKFGYLLEAFDFGAPPHGGIAYGVDRLAMILAGKESIRDVIAFPKSTTAQCLLTHAPSSVDAQQLRDLSLQALPHDHK